MKLFVFKEVLIDYTGGMVLVVAEDYKQAIGFAFTHFDDYAFESGGDEGWSTPVAVYDVADDTEAGVREYIWGGG